VPWCNCGSDLVLSVWYDTEKKPGWSHGGAPLSKGDTMSGAETVYLNVSQITEVRQADVFVKDVAKVYCRDKNLQNRCNTVKIKSIKEDKKPWRYVESTMEMIRLLEAVDPAVQVNSIGEVNYIIDFIPQAPPNHIWQWLKTFAVCAISFCGAAFAIMTFNNDAGVKDIFGKIYQLVTGQESSGFTILELSYSIGLGLGILVFFNHFAKWKLNTDPTPLEVEMRTYETDISKTLIQNAGRKEQQMDVK